MALVIIDGNRLTLEDEICKTDKSLRDALVTFYPAVHNAKIKRDKKEDKLVITITKQAGEKGLYGPIAEALEAAPETINQVIAIRETGWRKIKPEDLDRALLTMLEDEAETTRVLTALDSAEPQSANTVPQGF